MIRWTGFVIAHRKRIVAAWLVLFVLGGLAAANLGGLLSNRFSVPGSESERGLNLIRDRMGDRSDGSFTLVATGVDTPAERAAVAAAARRGARAVEGGKAGPLLPAARGVVYAQIATPLENQDASKVTPEVRARDRPPGGHRDVPVGLSRRSTTTPRRSSTRTSARGESIGVPIAVIVMAVMFGTLGGIVRPIVFALMTIPTTLGLVWVFAHTMDMAIYVTNIVALIGLAIAVDYSMLVVFRYREELAKTDDRARGAETTMATAGPRDAVLRAAPSRSGSRCSSSCRCRSCARWASAACSSRSSRSPPRRRCCRRCWRYGPRREPLPVHPAARARAPRGGGR